MKTRFRIAASLVISAIFLYFAARGVSGERVLEALAQTRWVFIVPMALGGLLPLWFRALRWEVLLRPFVRVRMRTLLSATGIGFAANMVLPLRAGEIVRPWLLSRQEAVGFSQAIATVALERLFDMAMLLLFFGVATLTLPLPPDWKRYGWFFLSVFGVFVALVLAMRRYLQATVALAERLGRSLPAKMATAVVGAVHGFAEGLSMLGDVRAVSLALLYSLAIWLSIGLTFGFGLNALALDVPWFRGALTATTFVAIAVSIPGGPGFIGMFQVGCVVALGIFGVGKDLAFSYSVLTHVVQFASIVLIGIYFLLREGLQLAELGLAGRGRLPVARE